VNKYSFTAREAMYIIVHPRKHDNAGEPPQLFGWPVDMGNFVGYAQSLTVLRIL
jgi:hypothetical protein